MTRDEYWRLVPLVWILIGPTRMAAQAHRVTIELTDRASGLPIRHAEVIDRSNDRRRMTDDSGRVRIDWRDVDSMSLRVRQVGYHFVDTIVVRSHVGGTIAIPLSRVAYALPVLPITARDDCGFAADASNAMLAAAALEQLRMGAERYEGFRRQYPFLVKVERLTREFTTDGTVTREVVLDETVASGRWHERYVPGHVLSREGIGFSHNRIGFSAPILSIANLADPVFWHGHCFEVLGIETLNADRVVRLVFRPSRELSTPDWEGSALLDSATSELRRIEFRLVNTGTRDLPQRLEGYTTFRSPAPFIVLPESTAAVWWRRREGADSRFPDVLQVLRVKQVSYRSARPPR